jgi:hypothetical protein
VNVFVVVASFAAKWVLARPEEPFRDEALRFLKKWLDGKIHLLNLETLCSWLFLHFRASCITVFHGVWQGFVPKVVPRFERYLEF